MNSYSCVKLDDMVIFKTYLSVTERILRAFAHKRCVITMYQQHNLNWTRCGTGSQWRRSRSRCLMWLCYLAPTSNCAAVFSTDCRRSSSYRPWSPGQQTVAVVDSGDDEAVDYCFCDLQRQGTHTALNAAQLEEASADWLVDVCSERQFGVQNNPEVVHCRWRLDDRMYRMTLHASVYCDNLIPFNLSDNLSNLHLSAVFTVLLRNY